MAAMQPQLSEVDGIYLGLVLCEGHSQRSGDLPHQRRAQCTGPAALELVFGARTYTLNCNGYVTVFWSRVTVVTGRSAREPEDYCIFVPPWRRQRWLNALECIRHQGYERVGKLVTSSKPTL